MLSVGLASGFFASPGFAAGLSLLLGAALPVAGVVGVAAGATGGAASVGVKVVGILASGAGCVEAGPTPSPRDFLENNPGIENRKAIKKKQIAAAIVILANTVCVPRGPKAEEFAPPPPKTPDASDLLGCNSTNIINTKQEMI